MKPLSHIRRRLARPGKREGGQAIVEMALALPILLLLVMAIIQFSQVYNVYTTLTDAARVGARQLSIGRGLGDPCALAVSSTVGSTAGDMTLPSADVSTTFSGAKDVSPTPDTCGTGGSTGGGNENEGDTATVTITYKYTLNVFGLGLFNITLKPSASDDIE